MRFPLNLPDPMALHLPKLPLVRFYRRFPIIPGMLWLNVFKWGVSLSIGRQGFRITLGRSNFRGTVGLTGTGLFLTKNWGRDARNRRERELDESKTLSGAQNQKANEE